MNERMLQLMRWGREGYSCAQILFLLAFAARGGAHSGLVRSMAGLAYGGGSGLATCGAVTGGYCLLAFLSSENPDDDRPSDRLPLMLDELTDWFAARVGQSPGPVTCDAVVGPAGTAAARQECGLLVNDTYEQVLSILAAHGMWS